MEAINFVFDENFVCWNNKEDLEEVSFQKPETLHDENFENVECEITDEIEQENYSNSKITNSGSKIKTWSRIIAKRRPESKVIGDVEKGILTRRKAKIDEQENIDEHFCLISDNSGKKRKHKK